MKVHHQKRTSEGIGQIALLRMHVTAAESNLKQAKESLSRAKRRRKLARLLAKRAKKDARQAKESLADARAALANAEAKLGIEARHAARRKTNKPKSVARSTTRRPATKRRVRKSRSSDLTANVREPSPAPETTVPSENLVVRNIESEISPPPTSTGEVSATPSSERTDS